MIIHNINNAEKLFGFLDSCKGDLQLILPDGKNYQWKSNNSLVKPLLRDLAAKNLRLELRATNKDDTNCILTFMMEATKEIQAS